MYIQVNQLFTHYVQKVFMSQRVLIGANILTSEPHLITGERRCEDLPVAVQIFNPPVPRKAGCVAMPQGLPPNFCILGGLVAGNPSDGSLLDKRRPDETEVCLADYKHVWLQIGVNICMVVSV